MHALAWPARVLAGAAVAVLAGTAAVGATTSAKPQETTFSLFPQRGVINCLKPHLDSPDPQVTVTARRGDLNDRATIHLSGFKPNLGFDLFTIQHSPQTATGTPDANPSVGLAWYQTDLQVDQHGNGEARIRTVLLDQIFGIDKDVALAPTNTFHLGFWFNNPADATNCNFTGSTPFNGEHHAGPLAFVTRPDPVTNLGPLCTDPISGSGGTFSCNP